MSAAFIIFCLGVHYSRSSSQDPKRKRLVAIEAKSPNLNIFHFDSGQRLFSMFIVLICLVNGTEDICNVGCFALY